MVLGRSCDGCFAERGGRAAEREEEREGGEGGVVESLGVLGRGEMPAMWPLRVVVLTLGGRGREVMKASTAGRVALAGLGLLGFLTFFGALTAAAAAEAAAVTGSTAAAAGVCFLALGEVGALATGAAAPAAGLSSFIIFGCCCLGVAAGVGLGRGMAASAAAAASSFCFSCCCFRRTSTESTSGKRATAGSSRLNTIFPPLFPPSFSSLIASWREAIFCCRFRALVEKVEEGGKGAVSELKLRRNSLGPLMRRMTSSSTSAAAAATFAFAAAGFFCCCGCFCLGGWGTRFGRGW